MRFGRRGRGVCVGGCLLLVLPRFQEAPDTLEPHDDKTHGMEVEETDAECEGRTEGGVGVEKLRLVL